MPDLKKFKISLPDYYLWLKRLMINNWIVTVSLFGLAFILAVFVWWRCVFYDTPRAAVVRNYNNSKVDFEQMSKKVSGAIEKLQKRKEEFESARDYSGQREIFREKKAVENPATPIRKPAAKNNSPSDKEGPAPRPVQ